MRRTESRLPLITFAAAVVVAFFAIAGYALHRQQLGDQRYERQRDAICKVLASLPGQHPFPGIERLRIVESRPHHPHDCQPLPKTTPTPSNAKAGSSPGTSGPAVVLIPAPVVRPAPASPAPSRTASPRPEPDPSPTSDPSSKPTPCTLHDLVTDPTSCLHL